MSEEKPSIPAVVYSNVVTTISRWWSRVTQRAEESEDDGEIYENKFTSFPLKSILKKNKEEEAPHARRHLTDVVPAVMLLASYNTNRREREAAPNRKGPIPTEDLPVLERGQIRLTHASLNPSNFGNVAGHVIFFYCMICVTV